MNDATLQDHPGSGPSKPAPLRLLILEDRPADAELMVHHLERSGFAPEWQRVENEQEFASALVPELDLVLADYQLPRYDALRALARMRLSGLETPFIIVSGSIQEELAVEAMRHGAADFLIKDRMARLGPAVVHALEERRLREDNRRAHEGLRRFEELSRHIISTAHELARLTPQYERLSALAHELAATPAQAAAVAAADAPVREYLESRLGDLLQAFNQFTVSGRLPAGPGPGAEEAPALLASVQDAIRVLEQTRRSFKSRALGSLRERLEAVVRSLAPASAANDVERPSVLGTSR